MEFTGSLEVTHGADKSKPRFVNPDSKADLLTTAHASKGGTLYIYIYMYIYIYIFLGLYLKHMEFPRLGIEL